MGSACVNHFSCQKVAKTVENEAAKKIKFKSTTHSLSDFLIGDDKLWKMAVACVCM